MALTPGTRLGPYEVTALLGVGGMGEVYRATDTNLGRAVAIKVLPDAVAQDADRLARFDREARTLAALNHPHIAAIYGLERSGPGSAGASGPAGTIALVMELVDGPTLADRIGQGPIPIDEALPIARQIAEALEAAHEQGIIHRDLKPANVKVRDDGTVKVLDFGLAKAMEPTGALATSQSLSPTITTPAMTQAGMILGTAAYMSPEQARGRTVDKRTDVWAFGVVLYEMLTGTRAFDSEDLSLTLADVMRAEPAWERLPQNLAPSIVTVLKRCLRKDPKERLRDIGDVRLALDGAFETGAAPADGAAAAASGASHAGHGPILAVGVGSLLVGGFVATLAWIAGAPSPPPGEVRHASIVMTVDGTLAGLAENQVPGLDGAGRVLVVRDSGSNQLLARRFDRADAVPLPGTEGASNFGFAVSPDGDWVAFVANQQLQKMSMTGGAPASLHAAPDATPGIAWAGTDSVIIGTRAGLVRVPAGGGTAEQVTTVDTGAGEVDHRTPYVTPDGAILAYTVWLGSNVTSRVRVRNLQSGAERTLMLGQHPKVTPTGHLVFGRDTSLWAAPFDSNTLEVRREPVPVLDGVNSSLSATTYYALSSDGTLVYTRRLERAEPVARLDRSGTTVGVIGEAFAGVHHGPPALSPDGTLLAICRHAVGGQDQVVVLDLRRGRTIAVGGAGDSRYPVWTKDGTRLAFLSGRNGTADIFEVALDRPGDPQPLLVRPGVQTPGSWTPDGEVLAYTEGQAGDADIWLLPREGEPSPLLANPAFNEAFPAFSLDGRLLAYTSNESGRPEVYVQTYPSGDGHTVVSSGGARRPSWARDGLYYEDLDGRVFFVPLAAGGSRLADDTPQRLIETRVSGDASTWGVSSDGRTFFAFEDRIAPPGSLELVLNWHEELTRLVPID